jgi:SPP1 gp7 family putative phage head morphogenesis protein
MAPRRKNLLRPIRPNAGIEAAYRAKMRKLISEMARSFEYWVRASYRANEPIMAQDATPASQLRIELNRLAKHWNKRFRDAAPELAAYFARQAYRRSDEQLRQILKRAGMSVQFKMTPEMTDIMRATVAENVQLIRSIPEQYFTQVQGAVMRSVSAGRDLKTLSDELREHYGVSHRRAAFIARDQSNKMTANVQRARQTKLGITEGEWVHSHGGKKPRKTHLANDGKRFNIATGWHDPDPRVDRKIWPGELPNCRCVWTAVVPGLT